MNYFSHFYVLPNYNKPYLTMGSILPDMLRNAKSELATLKISTKNENTDEIDLITGIFNHIEVDRKFHNSEFFFEQTKYMAKTIRDYEQISMNRYTQFYGHILLELLIDYCLLKDNSHLLNTFYSQLNEIDFHRIEKTFALHFPSQDVELFWETFEKFLQRKFLEDYSSLEKVINFSFHVYEKTTKKNIPRQETQNYVTLTAEKILPSIDKNLAFLFRFLQSTP